MMKSSAQNLPHLLHSKQLSKEGSAVYALLILVVALALFFLMALSSATSVAPSTQPAGVAAIPTLAKSLTLHAKSAVVFDLSTGALIYSLHPSAQLPLASLTKVPLALAVAEVLPLDSTITIPYDVAQTSHTSKLTRGEKYLVHDLMSFMLAGSSNEAAKILADTADEPLRAKYPNAPVGAAAVWRMNTMVQDMQLSHMYFLNPSGLDETTKQAGAYGSAYDVAMLFAYAAQSKTSLFADTAEQKVVITSEAGVVATADNTDLALNSIPGLMIGKTGTTDLAGGNLAVVYNVGLNHPIVAVVLGSTDDGRYEDMRALIAATETKLSRAD